MDTAVKTPKSRTNRVDLNAQEPRRLTKAGQFMRDNPNGLFVIVNRKVVNQ